jgi:hypothetical protein
MGPQLILFIIGGETATNTDFLMLQIAYEYKTFLTRDSRSLGLDYLTSISPQL